MKRQVWTARLLAVLFAATVAWPAIAIAQDDHATDDGHMHVGDDHLHVEEEVDLHGDDHAHGDDQGDEHGAHGDGDHAEGHAEDHGIHWNEVIATIINFFIYLGVIVYFGRKPINNYFASRRANVEDNIEKSARLHEEAEAKLAQFTEKMAGFEAEKEAVLAEFRKLGEAEKERIIAEAKDQAEKIRREAALRVEQDARSARAQLESRLVDAALSQAREEVANRLSADVQRKLIDGYITDLGSSQL